MEGDKRMQRLVGWRIESQRMDERLLLESIEKEEGLERVKGLRKAHQEAYRVKDMAMDWSTESEEEGMEVDWVEEETKEHAFLTIMMEKLEMGFKMNTYMEVELDDSIDEELEHTYLDKILQEWDADVLMVEDWKAKTDLEGEDMPYLHDLLGEQVWKYVEKDPRVGSGEMDADDQMVEGVV